MNIYSVKTINSNISSDEDNFIANAEKFYNDELETVARFINDTPEKPLILLSGPSGSGKTTSAHRISNLLKTIYGIDVHIISMDNYFLPLNGEETELYSKGLLDLETPKRLDQELFTTQMEKICNGELVTIPLFDFPTQTRKTGKTFAIKANERVIIEGIHALNPDITRELLHSSLTVYVSVRTRIENTQGELLHPSRIRLMRRIVRDGLFRSRSALETLGAFEDVERGEQLYIMPYKGLAQFDIDTFFPYEASVYKQLVLPSMFELEEHRLYGKYCKELINFLTALDAIPSQKVPQNSLLREFIGR